MHSTHDFANDTVWGCILLIHVLAVLALFPPVEYGSTSFHHLMMTYSTPPTNNYKQCMEISPNAHCIALLLYRK